MKISFTKKEIGSLLLSALVLGLVFGFNDGRDIFVPRLWFANYMLMVSLSLIVLGVMVLGHKWAAARYSIQTEYKIWGITRFGFREYQYLHKNPLMTRVPLGIILPILIAVFTEGQIWFAAIGMILTQIKTEHRIGRKWIQIPEYEEARVAFAGPVAIMIGIIILGLLFENTGLEIWRQLIFISMAVLISHMLPFPQLAGGRLLFTSFYLFTFAVVLTAAVSALILFIPTIPTLIIALLLAILTVIMVYFKREV